MYSGDWGEYLPPGKEDVETTAPNTRGVFAAGYWRWHGRRKNGDYPFDPRLGYLAPYMGLPSMRVEQQIADTRTADQVRGEISKLQGIKMCPSFVSYYADGNRNSYEWGAGGYGYNCQFVGSQEGYKGGTWTGGEMNAFGECESGWYGSRRAMFKDLSRTIAFADCAMPQAQGGVRYYVEESEIVAPWFLKTFATSEWGTPVVDPSTRGKPKPQKDWGMANPTMHFRHDGMANVLWLDGRVSAHRMDFSKPGLNAYNADSSAMGVGWFGTDDFSFWGDYK